MDQSRAPQAGQVVDHQFLWADEHGAGQVEGRKSRPCVIIAVEARQDGPPHVTDQRNARCKATSAVLYFSYDQNGSHHDDYSQARVA